MTKSETAVAIVDDDSIYQFAARRIIELSYPLSTVQQFKSGSDALDYITSHSEAFEKLPDVILLDLNMPITDGWMFLDTYKKIKSTVCKDIIIYIVTSSIDARDISNAKRYPEVKGYISKPLEVDRIKEILTLDRKLSA